MTGPARAQLLAALADVGVQPDDYELIEQARALIDDVNARLRTRGSRMIYMITFCNSTPLRSSDRAAILDAAHLDAAQFDAAQFDGAAQQSD